MFDNEWLASAVASANDDNRFITATTQFDGSLALQMGTEVAWFKIYRGEILDRESYVPPFGATFRLVGDEEAWDSLVDGGLSLSEALYDGSLRMTGNKLEANRMREAVELFVRHLQTAADESAVMV
jgi:putative sterol carrier protein